MNIFLGFFALLLSVLSFSGFVLYLYSEKRIRIEFAPVMVCCLLGIIMVFAGFIGMMRLMIYILYAAGCSLLLRAVIRKRVPSRLFRTPAVIFIIFATLYCIWRLYGLQVSHYDNFSHWLLVIRYIIENNVLPSQATNLIYFQSYPTGSACLIYYFCAFAPVSEFLFALVQAFFINCCILPLFVFCRNNRRLGYFLIVITYIYMLISNVFITDLLVDTVLPLTGLSAIVIISYFRNDYGKALLYSIPILCMSVLIKNSGIYFAFISALALAVIAGYSQNIVKARLFAFLGGLGFPGMILLVWLLHVKAVYPNGLTTKHAMSPSNFIDSFKAKTWDDIWNIAKMMWSQVTNATTAANQILIVGLSALVLLALFFTFQKNKLMLIRLANAAGLFFIVYATWQFSLFDMYVFSMRGSEASTIAGYSRYNLSILIFLWGLLLLLFLETLNILEYKPLWRNIGSIAASMIIFCSIVIPIGILAPNACLLFNRSENYNGLRSTIAKMITLNNIPSGKTYLVYVNENRKAFYSYLAKYEFQSSYVRIATKDTYKDVFLSSKDFMYVIFFDVNNDALDYYNNLSGNIVGDAKLILPM